MPAEGIKEEDFTEGNFIELNPVKYQFTPHIFELYACLFCLTAAVRLLSTDNGNDIFLSFSTSGD